MSVDNLDTPFDSDLLFGAGSGGENVKILSYAAEGTPITRADVQAYQSQLLAVRQQANSQIAKPLIGLLSSVDNPLSAQQGASETAPPVQRGFGLSDEGTMSSSTAVAGVDKAEIQSIISQLQFDVEPVHRAWATPQQQMAEQGSFYNYGLNPHLLKEYIEAQIALRIEKSRRTSVTVGNGGVVSGNTENAFMRPPTAPPVHPVDQGWAVNTDQAWGSWDAPPQQSSWQTATTDDPWKV
jgi:hypothetical protein